MTGDYYLFIGPVAYRLCCFTKQTHGFRGQLVRSGYKRTTGQIELDHALAVYTEHPPFAGAAAAVVILDFELILVYAASAHQFAVLVAPVP